MRTREIWHEVLVNTSRTHLYDCLTDPAKLAHWWTTDTRGESALGKQLEFWFGNFRGSVMEVRALKQDEFVQWHVIGGGATDWLGTDVEFDIFEKEGKTFLHFRHSNWREDAKTFPHCSMGWAIFMLSLKEFAETGKGRPYPYDTPVNLWHPPQ